MKKNHKIILAVVAGLVIAGGTYYYIKTYGLGSVLPAKS